MKKLVVANWKMNKTPKESLSFLEKFLPLLDGIKESSVSVGIAPPFTSLYPMGQVLKKSSVFLAAQNMYFEEKGAFTGEISPLMLKEVGCSYVIVGHSERRTLFGENGEVIRKKVESAINHDLIPILCVGETIQDRNMGLHKSVVEKQVLEAVEHPVESIVVAYEPVWAIGTGLTPESQEIEEMHSFIKDVLSERVSNLRVIYGGSVTENNAGLIASSRNVDGFLVGGASLDPVRFFRIVQEACEV